MVTNYKNSSTLVSFFTILMFVCLITDYASASSFKVWEGPGCTGHFRTFHGCGCADVPHGFHGGYEFDYTGESITFYNNHGCHDVHDRFDHDVHKCHKFGFKSVKIHC
ncbi:hypothetical protein MKW98_031767 [Papaver atlanticum]|uniref:Uncharacterized protein n=1 Tax=Papaver atlanticum TaxID=357466 RepID=A0AAD4XUY5_9MAGN|nr:hypothetical protein MKW98_031767 [Papaver atlanticum]